MKSKSPPNLLMEGITQPSPNKESHHVVPIPKLVGPSPQRELFVTSTRIAVLRIFIFVVDGGIINFTINI